jgi:L-alanine-DL-glutamate epimerase-like enolase superfamily enzyme
MLKSRYGPGPGMGQFSLFKVNLTECLLSDIAENAVYSSYRQIAQLAEPYGARVSPHCWNSTIVAVAAMTHASAVIPNALIGEYFPDFVGFCSRLGASDLDISDSSATIGDEPGLGVHMDAEALSSWEV